MKDAVPDGFWTYPPVARLSATVRLLTAVATARNWRKRSMMAMVVSPALLTVRSAWGAPTATWESYIPTWHRVGGGVRGACVCVD